MYQQQQPQNNDRFMQYLAMMQVLRGQSGGAESQIHTNETVTIRSRAALPLIQGVIVTFMFCGFVGGIILFTAGIAYLLDLKWTPNDFVAAWVLIFMVAAGIAWIVRRLFMVSTKIVRAIIIVFTLLILGIAVTSLLLAVHTSETGPMVRLIFGAALIFGCGLVLYNQAMDIAEPYWRRSPLEQAIIREVLPSLGNLLSGDDGPTVIQYDPRFPVTRKNGELVKMDQAPSSKQRVRRKTKEPVADKPKVIETIAPEAGNLVWFGLWALGCKDLSYGSLTTRPAPWLPFSEDGKQHRLRRNTIQVMLARGSTNEITEVNGEQIIGLGENGWWHLRGQGAKTEWALEPDEARKRIKSMWQKAMGDVPLPDPHTETQYRYVKEVDDE